MNHSNTILTASKSIIVTFLMIISLSSCNKQEQPEPEANRVVHSAARTSAVTYSTLPTTNTYTNCGSLEVRSCNNRSYIGGNIRAKVLRVDGSQIIIRIERCNNQQLFGGAGTAFIRATNICGTQAGTVPIQTNHWYADVTINATFTTGSVDFVPVVELPAQKTYWFGQPIRITAQTVLEDSFPGTVITSTNSTSRFATTDNAFKGNLIGQCTWYTYGRIQELVASGYLSQNTGTMIKNAFWGKSGRDAKNWPAFIGGTWYNTNTSVLPLSVRKKGLIIVWAAGTNGHVGFVEWVSADKKRYRVSDFNLKEDLKYRTTEYYFDGGSDKLLGTYPRFYDLGAIK